MKQHLREHRSLELPLKRRMRRKWYVWGSCFTCLGWWGSDWLLLAQLRAPLCKSQGSGTDYCAGGVWAARLGGDDKLLLAPGQ